MDTQKLPPAFKEKWVAALRSGEYQQSKQCLFDGVGYCCLGVACVVAGLEWAGHTQSFPYQIPGIKQSALPEILHNDFGNYVAGKPASEQYNVSCALAALNDDGKSFSEIADYIEANL